MAASTTKSAYLQGLLAGAPFVLVALPFSMLFGVVAAEAGLDLLTTMSFSALVIAGAAQFAALQMMNQDAAVWAVLATSLAVNLRMAMYSAALVPHLGSVPLWQRALVAYGNFDQSYAAAIAEYEKRPEMPARWKAIFFLGVATPVGGFWYAGTVIGALLGSTIPDWLALDFALPITFLALLGPMLKTAAHLAAALVSVVVALALAWMPAGLGLLIAGAAAMGTGAAVELAMERRR